MINVCRYKKQEAFLELPSTVTLKFKILESQMIWIFWTLKTKVSKQDILHHQHYKGKFLSYPFSMHQMTIK